MSRISKLENTVSQLIREVDLLQMQVACKHVFSFEKQIRRLEDPPLIIYVCWKCRLKRKIEIEEIPEKDRAALKELGVLK